MKTPIRAALWACVLAVFSPRRFLEFQERRAESIGIPAASDDSTVDAVSHAFWGSLVLVLLSAAIGALAGAACRWLLTPVPGYIVKWLQITGTSLLLWGTLFVRGWEIQTYKGRTLVERVNQWIYRALYCAGTAILVSSLTVAPI